MKVFDISFPSDRGFLPTFTATLWFLTECFIYGCVCVCVFAIYSLGWGYHSFSFAWACFFFFVPQNLRLGGVFKCVEMSRFLTNEYVIYIYISATYSKKVVIVILYWVKKTSLAVNLWSALENFSLQILNNLNSVKSML